MFHDDEALDSLVRGQAVRYHRAAPQRPVPALETIRRALLCRITSESDLGGVREMAGNCDADDL